jgi:peptide/nickel transport system substrate-binding protein
MKKTKAAVILLCVIMLCALAACNNGGAVSDTGAPAAGAASPDSTPDSPESAAPGRDTLYAAVSQDGGTLDPIGMSGNWLNIIPCYMEPLWNYKENFEIEWHLATGYDQVGPTQYTVHIREGVTFSNGNPLTADDVLFTFQLSKDAPNRAMTVSEVDFEKTRAIDEYTIDLHLNIPIIGRMVRLGQVFITDAESYDPVDFSLHPVGTGPYVVTEYLVNSHVYMQALENYWGERPAIENIQFRVLNEASQQVNALETKTVDVSTIPSSDIAYVEGLSGYDVKFYKTGGCTQVLFNVNEASVFSSLEARYAVCHAIDRQAIADIVYDGYVDVADNPVSMATSDYEPRFGNLDDTYAIGYDPALARQYAESSGLAGKEISIMTNGAPEYVAMAEIIQAGLRGIGVTVVINNYDQATLRATYRSDPSFYDICLYYTQNPYMTTYNTLYNSAALSEILMADGAWEGLDRFNELGADYVYMADDQERQEALYEMIQIFTKACPWYGVSDLTIATAYSTDLRGIELYDLGGVIYHKLSFAR